MLLPGTFNVLIEQRRGPLSAAYVRALIKHESDFDPRSVDPRSSARGLMAIVSTVRKEYNRRHGTRYTKADLWDPAVNLRIGLWQLKAIVQQWAKLHPDTLAPDWTRADYIRLLTLGWNAGYSERGGVGRVVRYLEQHNQPVTWETVTATAAQAGAGQYVQDLRRHNFARRVARTYFRELDEIERQPVARRGRGGTQLLALAVLALVIVGAVV